MFSSWIFPKLNIAVLTSVSYKCFPREIFQYYILLFYLVHCGTNLWCFSFVSLIGWSLKDWRSLEPSLHSSAINWRTWDTLKVKENLQTCSSNAQSIFIDKKRMRMKTRKLACIWKILTSELIQGANWKTKYILVNQVAPSLPWHPVKRNKLVRKHF